MYWRRCASLSLLQFFTPLQQVSNELRIDAPWFRQRKSPFYRTSGVHFLHRFNRDARPFMNDNDICATLFIPRFDGDRHAALIGVPNQPYLWVLLCQLMCNLFRLIR